MKSFSLLWSTLLESSLWIGGTKDAKLVWVTMLAKKDVNGEVHTSLMGLAHWAVMSLDECRSAVDFLEAPDPYSQNPDEEGRRIIPIEGGWRIVSHEKYRFSMSDARGYWRQKKKESRARVKNSGPLPGEVAAIKAYENGDTETHDRIAGGMEKDL